MTSSPSTKRITAVSLAVALFVAEPSVIAGQIEAVWMGGAGNWSDSTKWDIGIPPNNATDTYLVRIDNGNGTASIVSLNMSTTIDCLVLDADDLLVTSGSSRILTLAGGPLTNNGEIRLNDVGGGITALRVSGNVTLDGSGRVVYFSNDDNFIDSVSPDNTLTISSGQTITTSAVSTLDNSALRAAAINEGVIEANVGRLELNTNDKVNHNIIRAVNGGQLEIEGIAIDNASGAITAAEGSQINLDGATIRGGRLDGPGIFQTDAGGGVLDGISDAVTIGAATRCEVNASNEVLTLRGTINNDGTLRIIDAGSAVATILADGPVALSGSGKILFDGSDDARLTSTDPASVVTIGPDQTVTTSTITTLNNSEFNAAAVNDGIIEANVGALDLMTYDKTNRNVIQAVGGGNLRVGEITIQNAGATLLADTGSTITLHAAAVAGGTLAGAGVFDVTTGDGTLDGSGEALTIASDALVQVNASDEIIYVRGTVINDGVIRVRDAGTSAASLRTNGNAQLAGSGVVLLEGSDDNHIDSADPSHTLTIGPEQTITTAADTLFSNSEVRAALVNQGTVEANEGDLEVNTHAKTNEGVFQAVNGGRLRLLNVAIENSNGIFRTDGASAILAEGATISGGLIDGDGVFQIIATTTRLESGANGLTIAAGTHVVANSGAAFTAGEGIVINGELRLNDTTTGVSQLRLDAGGAEYSFDGTGRIVFAGAGSENDMIIVGASAADTWRIMPGLLLHNDPGGIGQLQLDTVNTGTLRIESTIWVNGSDLVNGPGGVIEGTSDLRVNNAGTFTNNGVVAPGLPVGKLTVTGVFTQGAGGTLAIEMAGTGAGQFDELAVTAAANLAGTIRATAADGFVPQVGDRFRVVTFGSRTGRFDAFEEVDFPVGLEAEVIYTTTTATLVIVRRGDMNCDGSFDGADIDPFFLALGDPVAWSTQYPECEIHNADVNRDGAVDGADIDVFFLCLGLGSCP